MKFVLGLIVGLVIGGCLGMNYGSGDALLSNPFAEKSMAEKMLDKGEEFGGDIISAGEDALEKGAELLP